MAFRDLADIIGPLVLPINGKNYTLPQPTLAEGVRLRAAMAGQTPMGNDELYRIILGDTLAELQADYGENAPAIDRVFWTAMADFQRGRTAAEQMWEDGGPDPKAVQAYLDAQASTVPAAATTTKRRASGTGTKTSRTK